jgi:LysM repeat protein
VKNGDTLELIAAEYNGDRKHKIFVMGANKILHPRKLRAGEKLKVPMNRDVTTSPGETFESLAAAYLGDGRRARFLAEFNRMAPSDSIAAGSTLSVPFHVSHTAEATESLSQIAAAWTGDGKNGAMLREYNFLQKDSLAKGETIVIPIVHVHVRASRQTAPDAESRSRTEKRETVRIAALAALPNAHKAWRAGDYKAVKDALADIAIDLDYLDATTAAEVGLLFGCAQVAFQDGATTGKATFAKVLERRPGLALHRFHYSPKILAVWKEAGGAIDGDK